jgi:hypothetical protein
LHRRVRVVLMCRAIGERVACDEHGVKHVRAPPPGGGAEA